uniref:TNFR-Cys domain-containing protein n=1 Tax=Sarcophilus harrisii TaxID=9305 RepID=A0A7N4PNV3_SARHA
MCIWGCQGGIRGRVGLEWSDVIDADSLIPVGYKLHGMCSIMRGTMCVPCDPGTYTAHENVLKKCFQCKVCDPELGLVTRRECSSTSNTVCSCSSGYFCTDTKDDNCEKCVGPRVCSPGQYVKSRGMPAPSPSTQRPRTIIGCCPNFPVSPPTSAIIFSCHLSQSDRCVVVSQSCLNLHFSDQ